MNDIFPKGLKIIEPRVFEDDRGYFFETFNKKSILEKFGIDADFVQDNESMSKKHTIRGLHWQAGDNAQAKLVRVIKGAVIDFVLDIRKSSETFGKLTCVYLSEENKKQFFVPRGFAHGFISLKDDTIFSYKCDNFYDKASERGINVLDPELNVLKKIITFIDRSLAYREDISDFVMSDKDKLHPTFSNAVDLFN